MKLTHRIACLTILLTCGQSNFAQQFTGELIKTLEIELIDKTLNADSIRTSQPGDSNIYVISENRYKSTYYKDGKYSYSYIYHDDTKRMYDDYADRDYLSFRDSRKSINKLKESKVFRDSLVMALNYECYVAIRESDYSKSYSYFSDEIQVNEENFKGHKIGNWHASLKETGGCISLENGSLFDTHIEKWKPQSIVKRKVKRTEFDLPDKPIVASMEALDVQVDLKQPSQATIQCFQEKFLNVSKQQGEKVTIYTSLVVNVDGTIEHVEPYEEDSDGFYKTAVDIIKNCGFEFIPGQIEGEAINSLLYFPIEFYR